MTTKPRHIALALALATAVAAVSVGLYLPSSALRPGLSVPWTLGFLQVQLDPATVTGATVIPIEAYKPGCVTDAGWFDTFVTYTPISVTIQIRMTDAAVAKCISNPRTGEHYLLGEFVRVRLSEPLDGRALFDGSTFPAAARPYR